MATKSNEFLVEYNTQSDHKITIPIIQRDYVQGANIWSTKRDAFLRALLTSLALNRPQQLDFIYGNIENGCFVPLDGQQRITTLNLLGWMILQYIEPSEQAEAWYAMLGLGYETRDSSGEFCRNLFSTRISRDATPSSEIHNQIWFSENWVYDPTIKAMLEMLDRIGQLLQDGLDGKFVDTDENILPVFDLQEIAHRFFEDSPIEFEKLDLSLKTSSDDLYIKINARGKDLTDFEHWKSNFIQLLGKYHDDPAKPYSKESGQTPKEYFEERIEKEWCMLFWDYALNDYMLNSNDTKSYPRIDEYFIRLFDFITGFIWLEQPDNNKMPLYRDMDFHEKIRESNKIYTNRDNLDRLFKIFDGLYNLRREMIFKDAIESFFKKYFYSTTDPKDSRITESEKINIFHENENLNLFNDLIEGKNLSIRPSYLLWGIFEHLALYGDNEHTLDFIRLWWGYLMNRRQRRKERYEVKADIDMLDYIRNGIKSDLQKLLSNIDPFKGFTEINTKAVSEWHKFNNINILDHSRYKKDIIPLQNHPWLLYDVHNLEKCIMDTSIPFGEVYSRFYNRFVDIDNKDRVLKLLNNGFDGVRTTDKETCRTFGFNENWPYILTDENSIKEPLTMVLNGNTDIKKGQPEWLVDFIIKNIDPLLDKKDTFAAFLISDQKNQLFSIPVGYSHGRNGYRLEPYNYVIATKSNEVEFVEDGIKLIGKDIHLTLVTNYSTHFGICFVEYGIQMECGAYGWKIERYNDTPVKELPQSFLDRFNSLETLSDKLEVFNINNNFVQNLTNKDVVETGVELLNAIYSTL